MRQALRSNWDGLKTFMSCEIARPLLHGVPFRKVRNLTNGSPGHAGRRGISTAVGLIANMFGRIRGVPLIASHGNHRYSNDIYSIEVIITHLVNDIYTVG